MRRYSDRQTNTVTTVRCHTATCFIVTPSPLAILFNPTKLPLSGSSVRKFPSYFSPLTLTRGIYGRWSRNARSEFRLRHHLYRRVAETKLRGWVYSAEIPPLVSRNLTARLWRVKFVPDRALLALLKEGFGHKVFEAALVRQVGSRMTSICKVPRDKTGRYLQS